jgi:hypothetical protein
MVPKQNNGTPQRHLATQRSPAIARRFAVVRWKLGGFASARRTNRERFMADCEAIAIGGRAVLKAENYPCLQKTVSSTAKSPLL